MKPLRVEVEGFLTYHERTVFAFDSTWLWVITGNNGAGKSAIFDAITYALYGTHRGGDQHDEKLVSQGRDHMHVRVDFAVGAHLYRVERSIDLRRDRGKVTSDKSYQAYHLAGPCDPNAVDAVPIAGTDRVKGLEEWVVRVTGLRYHTFVASILLQQGKADRFVLAGARERQGILMELLDLDIYKRLETAVKMRHRTCAEKYSDVERELGGYASVTPAALAEARERVEALSASADRADQAVDAAVRTRERAETFARRERGLREAREQMQRAEALLAEEKSIKADAAELAALQEALPLLSRIAAHCRTAEDCDVAEAALRGQAAALNLAALEGDQVSAEKAAAEAERAYEAARRATSAARRDADNLRATADAGSEALRLHTECAEADNTLARMAPELTGMADALAWEEQCSAAREALAPLRSVRQQRRIAADAEEKRAAAEASLPGLRDDADTLEEQARSAQGQYSETAELAQCLALALAGRQADLATASHETRARQEAAGDGTCSRCGQPIDAEQIADEIDQAEARVAELRRLVAEVERQASEAVGEATRLRVTAVTLATQRDEAARAVAEAEETARAEAVKRDEAEEQAEQIVGALPPLYRMPAGDAGYPTAEKIEGVATLAAAATAAQAEAGRLRTVQTRAALLDEQNVARRACLTALTAQYPGVDLGAVPARYETLRSRATECDRREEAARAAWQQAKEWADTTLEKARAAGERHRRLIAAAGEKEGTAAAAREAAGALAGILTLDWQALAPTEDGAAQAARYRIDELDEAPARKVALDDARRDHAAIVAAITAHETAIAEIPADDRVSIEEAEERLTHAKDGQKACKGEVTQATGDATLLTARLQQRRDLEDRGEDLRIRRDDYKQLAALLGRDGLQAWLVREAQEAIGQAANIFLSAISGGMLGLDMAPDGDDLEILVRDLSSGDEALDVAFISGSQRFRAAVAVALAIGQYSGGGARDIRSVIIDEGFGSLDGDGRRDMIAQLKGLEGLLEKVIIVSHQEEFHDAFPNGYHIVKTGGISHAYQRNGVASNESVTLH